MSAQRRNASVDQYRKRRIVCLVSRICKSLIVAAEKRTDIQVSKKLFMFYISSGIDS